MSQAMTPPNVDELAPLEEQPDLHGCTAVVLGAGASRPYGFPTGEELVKYICDRFPAFFEGLSEYGSTASDRRAKAEGLVSQLRDSACKSIDDFLAYQQISKELDSVGRIAIASSLLPKEDEHDLRERDDWYEHLINRWCEELERGSLFRLGVITFNYERSLEHRLWLALVSRLGESLARDYMVIGQTRVFDFTYVHGCFGDLPWRYCDGSGIPYGVGSKHELHATVLQAAKQLKTVHDPPIPGVSAVGGHVLVRASRVLFLGFSYNPSNLQKVRTAWEGEMLKSDATIAGTAFGLPPGKVEEAQRTLQQWAGDDWHGRMEISDKKCLEAIRENNWLG